MGSWRSLAGRPRPLTPLLQSDGNLGQPSYPTYPTFSTINPTCEKTKDLEDDQRQLPRSECTINYPSRHLKPTSCKSPHQKLSRGFQTDPLPSPIDSTPRNQSRCLPIPPNERSIPSRRPVATNYLRAPHPTRNRASRTQLLCGK